MIEKSRCSRAPRQWQARGRGVAHYVSYVFRGSCWPPLFCSMRPFLTLDAGMFCWGTNCGGACCSTGVLGSASPPIELLADEKWFSPALLAPGDCALCIRGRVLLSHFIHTNIYNVTSKHRRYRWPWPVGHGLQCRWVIQWARASGTTNFFSNYRRRERNSRLRPCLGRLRPLHELAGHRCQSSPLCPVPSLPFSLVRALLSRCDDRDKDQSSLPLAGERGVTGT